MGPRPQQLLYRTGALAVPVGHEGHVEVGGFDLLRRDIGSIDGELRVDVPNTQPYIPTRRNAHRPNLGMPGEQPHELGTRVPTPSIDADFQSHAAHCRTFGYLFKFLHKPVDVLTRRCDNTPS